MGMAFSKTEQMLIDRVRAINDAGRGAYEHEVIDKTKGDIATGSVVSWRRVRVNQKPMAVQVRVFQRLLEGGHVLECSGMLFVPKHPALLEAARKQLKLRQETVARTERELAGLRAGVEIFQKLIDENS